MQKKLKFLIPSFADLFFIIFFIIILSKGGTLLNDGDTGYHIRAGEYIIENYSIPKEDIFSYLSPPPKWIAHEWLSEVIMAVIHDLTGLTGIVIFFTTFISFSFYIFFKILNSFFKNLILIWFIIIFVTICTAIHWLARPHIFSFLFFIIFYFSLENYENNEKINKLLILPILMLIWVNLHGGYVIGFILIGVYFVGNVFRLFSKNNEYLENNKSKAITYFYLGSACLITSIINPYGLKILIFPFNLIGEKFLMSVISEFMPTNMQETLAFKYLFYFSLTIMIGIDYKKNIIEIILFVLFSYMALYSIRYTTLFAIIVAPMILKRMEFLIDKYNSKKIKKIKNIGENIKNLDNKSKGYIWPILTVIFVFFLAKGGQLKYNINAERHPVDAVKFLLNEKISGQMFNNDEFGDYLIYAGYPEYKVFFDGRSDMYGTDFVKDFRKVIRLEYGWDKFIEEKEIGWIFYNSDSALSRMLYERKEWCLIYSDKIADIYVKNVAEYQYLINKYNGVKPVERLEEMVKREKGEKKKKLFGWIF